MASSTRSVLALTWFKSSYSGGNTTECVEAAHLAELTAVRDSKAPDGPRLTFSRAAWAPFVTSLQSTSPE
ncbi:DUF397 domain-containing protein [Streptomyces sp. NBC_00841]|uniref:DUF397 domain-containing protein n=1 Tax=unclassified Streptomyces TaxID=2593676 RepID=UPI0022545814|nr:MULTISPECIES: DUF397 domain-containing protein [unclassified Streptomyces]MCX4534871.1 DUF397 domain-containing protein [Streptomyces sp. NBC_01669]WRZ99802.1 DUF397 domain-containing protein [Streptomyces sp. NBC_00841]